ncbi:hypothetical protein [Bradyrhizobium sp. ARR65]|uniref:hypothetical protein n=1 Tax=Bradyrhizobium sp. ARR65 TaxID=1040989 RepID=UPI000A5006DE|nr:hypothetical protein [Bradyrhizobium sp. ARR65]
MRHEQQPLAFVQDAADFRINFQMTSGGARHACSVIIRASSKAGAATIFQENWSAIEKLARENLLASAEKAIRLQVE